MTAFKENCQTWKAVFKKIWTDLLIVTQFPSNILQEFGYNYLYRLMRIWLNINEHGGIMREVKCLEGIT